MRSLRFHGERATWLQPNSLPEFLRLKWEHPDARVVVGNTEVGPSLLQQCPLHSMIRSPVSGLTLSSVPVTASHSLSSVLLGIEVKFKNMVYPVILAPAFIPELNAVTHTDDGEYQHKETQI